VKPHGALYNQAARDERLAAAIARAVARVRPDLWLVGLTGSQMLTVWKDAGFRVAAEAFADRQYEHDGTLRARIHSGSLLQDPAAAAAQALQIALHGRGRRVGRVHRPHPGPDPLYSRRQPRRGGHRARRAAAAQAERVRVCPWHSGAGLG